jgi:hypothetical protein
MVRNLITLICVGLAGWALVGGIPYGILVAIILGACAVALFMERPKSGLRRPYDPRLRR